jgi:hypothetical protein
MKQFNLTNILIVIILGLLVYLALKPNSDGKYIDALRQESIKITEQIKANQVLIDKQLKELKVIEKKETIIRNYYNEIYKATDTLTTDVSAIANIRWWLEHLGTARFD